MDKRERAKVRRRYILGGIRNVLICDGIAIVILALIAAIYSLIKHHNFMTSLYMSFYYGGAFTLIIAVPQLFKRNEDPKLRKIRRASPLYGFYNWFGENRFEDEAMTESFNEFRGEGFWLGMMIVMFSCVLLILAVILEGFFFK